MEGARVKVWLKCYFDQYVGFIEQKCSFEHCSEVLIIKRYLKMALFWEKNICSVHLLRAASIGSGLYYMEV
jgi:hypothetical protein